MAVQFDAARETSRPRNTRNTAHYPPTEADQRANDLIMDLATTPPGDPRRTGLRQQAIEAWLPMAGRLGRRYAGRGESVDDLTQVATIGLIKAVDRFDPERGDDFVGYAVPTILGELRRHFRDRAWSLRVPRKIQEMRLAINDANAALSQSLNRLPTVADIAKHLGVGEEEVLEGLEGARAFRATSLSIPVSADATLELGDTLPEEEHGYDLVEIQLALGPALERLTPRERRILAMRFWGNQTQSVIATEIGVSQMHVSRILSAALAKLRTDLEAEPATR